MKLLLLLLLLKCYNFMLCLQSNEVHSTLRSFMQSACVCGCIYCLCRYCYCAGLLYSTCCYCAGLLYSCYNKIHFTLATTNTTLADTTAIAFCRSKQTTKFHSLQFIHLSTSSFQLSKLYLTEHLHRREFSLVHDSALFKCLLTAKNIFFFLSSFTKYN
jgi:hypothetical protein